MRRNWFNSHLRLLKLRGGSHDTAMSDTVDLIANKSSFRQIIENHVSCRIHVDSSEMCVWDWREICPWVKEYSDENKQFLLEPMPNSDIHILSLQPDQPAHLDGQWKMGRTRRGSFSGVHISHFTDVPDARQLILIYGGPWNFESCEVQCRMLVPALISPYPLSHHRLAATVHALPLLPGRVLQSARLLTKVERRSAPRVAKSSDWRRRVRTRCCPRTGQELKRPVMVAS
jgi:hypothetical protein